MDQWVQSFVRNVIEKYRITGGKVLDVGSKDYNGSVRTIFNSPSFEYTGFDMQAGDNVDVVGNANDMNMFTDEIFDCVVSCEMLEHDAYFQKSINEMRRVLKKGGLLIITARGVSRSGKSFKYHPVPNDFYRFTTYAYSDIFFKDYEKVKVEINDKHRDGIGIFGYGFKPLK